MNIKLVTYLSIIFVCCISCEQKQNSKITDKYSGYGFFYFTDDDDNNNFELRFIPISNSKDELINFSPKLNFDMGISFKCNSNDTGIIDNIRFYSKREFRIIKNNDYSLDHKSIAYYTPIHISFTTNNLKALISSKPTKECIMRNGKDSLLEVKYIQTNKDISSSIKIAHIIYLDTNITKTRKILGLNFNKTRKKLLLPELPVDWKYVPSFTIGNTITWINILNKNNPKPFYASKSVAYNNGNCIISEQNSFHGPLINRERQIMMETYYFVDSYNEKKHNRKYLFTRSASNNNLTKISKYQADSVLKVWGIEYK